MKKIFLAVLLTGICASPALQANNVLIGWIGLAASVVMLHDSYSVWRRAPDKARILRAFGASTFLLSLGLCSNNPEIITLGAVCSGSAMIGSQIASPYQEVNGRNALRGFLCGGAGFLSYKGMGALLNKIQD